MADDNVVSVQVTADVGDYVDAMKQSSAAAAQSMDAIKSAVAAATAQSAAALETMREEVEALKSTLGSSQGQIDELAEEVKRLQEALDKGTPAASGFGESIRQAGAKIRGEGRFAGFIARDLESILPITAQVGSAVAGMVAGIAYGSGIAVAVSAVRLLVQAFSDGPESVKKFSDDSAAALDKMKAQVADILATMNGESQAGGLTRKQVDPLEGQRDQQKQLVDDAAARLQTERAIELSQLAQGESTSADVKAAEKGLADATAKLNILEGQLRVSRELVSTVATKEDDKASTSASNSDSGAAAKINSKRLQDEEATNLKLLAERVQLANGEWKIDEENAVKIEQIHKETADRIKQINAEAQDKGPQAQLAADAAVASAQIEDAERVNLQSKIYVADMLNFRNDAEEKWNQDLENWRNKNLQLEAEAQKKIQELWSHQDKQREEIAKTRQKSDEAGAKSFVKDFIGPVESASSGFLKSVLLQQANVLDAVKSLAIGMAGAVIDGLVKMAAQSIAAAITSTAAAKASAVSETAGNIAVAATAAAKAVAGIPIIGPELAVAQFAETAGVLTGLSAPYLTSARGGMGEVPYDNMPAILHAKEMVMPEPLASGARNLFSAFSNGTPAPGAAQAGGSGGDHYHFHNHFEAGSIVDQQTLNKHYQSPEVQTAITQAVRLGKWKG